MGWFSRRTVVNFVTAKASGFNSLQQPKNVRILNLKDLQDGGLVDLLVPNQIPEPIGVCRILSLVSSFY